MFPVILQTISSDDVYWRGGSTCKWNNVYSLHPCVMQLATKQTSQVRTSTEPNATLYELNLRLCCFKVASSYSRGTRLDRWLQCSARMQWWEFRRST